MRKLTHSADDANREKGRMSRMVPVLATAVAVGMALTLGAPVRSDAEQPRRAQLCSASVERGSISAHTSTTPTSRLLRTPLLESNKYLQISMPNAYVEQVSQAASSIPEAGRPSFISNVMQNNVSAALAALGSNRSAAFQCVPPSSSSGASAAPQPAAPATTAPPAPQPAQPAPATDGGTEQPAPRRRVIQPGAPAASPSGKAAPAPKQDSPTISAGAPIAPIRKGGKGTEAEPYVIEIPVPSKRAAGAELYREKFPYLVSGERVSEKIYISLRFVAAPGTVVTSKGLLVGQIAPIASTLMREALRAKGSNDAPSSASLNSSISTIVGRAKQESPEISAYAKDA